MRTGSRSPGRPAIASQDGGRASRQSGANYGRALRVPTPTPGPGRAQTPDSRFSARRSFPRLPRPKVPQAPTNPCPAHGDPLRRAALTPAVSPLVAEATGRQRSAARAKPPAARLLGVQIERERERGRERRNLCFSPVPPRGGRELNRRRRSSKERIHSLHQIQDGGYLREAGERPGKSEG